MQNKVRKKITNVITAPCPTMFSFRSVDDFPELRVDQPRAVLRAFNGTRGRSKGVKPYTSSLLSSIGRKGLD